MRISRTALYAAVLLILASLLTMAGCTSQDGAVTDAGGSGNAPPRVLGVEHSIQPADKPVAENPEASQPSPLQAPRPELGVPAAEAKTPGSQPKTPGGKKVAYLTFDDGPNSDYTERVLDILRKKKVKASFAVVGKNVMINPEVLQRELADGHGLINHTYSHDYNIIYRSTEAFLADLDENNRILKKYTGKPVMLYRAPGGPDKLGKNIIGKLREKGYISVGWNISAVDSDPRGVTSSQVYNNIVSGLEKVEQLNLTPIILMHDGTQLATTMAKPGTPLAAYIQNREATLGALPAVIDHFRSKGYTFVVVDEQTPQAWQAN